MSDAGESVLSIGGRTVRENRAVGGVALVALLALPFITERFYILLMTEALIFTMFALGVDLIWGYTGIMTFGHAVFFGIGAYVMGKLLQGGAFGSVMSTYIGIVAGVVVTAILGLVIAGVLFYRGIQGGYFTIITLALAIIAEQTAISWSSVTGGFNGLTGIPPIELGVPGFLSVELLGLPLYYMALVVSALVFLASRRVAASPFGSVLMAINENETKARALGYEIERYKTLVFALGSAMAGLSGALYAGYQGFVSPNLLGFLLSTEVLLWILIGGRGTLIGAVVGTVFLLVFESLISGVFQFTWTLLLGIVLLIIVLRYPDGIVGVASQASLPWQGDAPEVELE